MQVTDHERAREYAATLTWLVLRIWLTMSCALVASAGYGRAPEWVSARPSAHAFEIAGARGAAEILASSGDHQVVGIAAADLAKDIERVTGKAAALLDADSVAPSRSKTQIWIGTLGRNAQIDRLIAKRRLDVSKLRGAWESFVIATVSKPAPGVASALVIVGSDRRGTAYGVYELSRAIGVSPWHWWADVPPRRSPSLYVTAGTRRFGPPSVKYRGIFINDEDWGLLPWAAGTFEPEAGTIGPKTYSRVFELLLRLKANSLWPAMHAVTQPFNQNPENARLADRYAIVMGSSHAEPMLRNNVGEWRDPPDAFDYVANRKGVLGYWEQRVRANGRLENIYTLGMRGIHDSGMVGPATMEERRATLERIFADQRALIARHVNPSAERVPQIFTPYKEVLDIYRAGLSVPDDVTIVWPDDNFGYIRQFPTDAERGRPGGSGVYYHLSYLGAPLAYLWLYTTPPSLVWEEMSKAYALGSRTLWIANVGDIKPAEIGIDLFLDMAWDMGRFQAPEAQRQFLRRWAADTFGAENAGEIARILDGHFRLNFERRPEHLQFWLPGERPRPSGLSLDEANARLDAFDRLIDASATVARKLPTAMRDAYFELVNYPVTGAALANHRFFDAEAHDLLADTDPVSAKRRGAAARAADNSLTAITRRYNEDVAGGKWRGLMSVEPADGQWKIFRTEPPALPSPALSALRPSRYSVGHAPASPAPGPTIIEAEQFASSKRGRDGGEWRLIAGLGRGEGSMAALPVTSASLPMANWRSDAARLDFEAVLTEGSWQIQLHLMPTQPIRPGGKLRLAISLDGGSPREIVVPNEVGSAVWSRAVLANRVSASISLAVANPGKHTLSLHMIEPGVVVDAIELNR